MKNDNDSEGLSIINDQVQGSQDRGESLGIYMKAIQKFPLLTKEQEVTYSKTIRKSKNEILKLWVSSEECLSELFILKDSGITELRKLFFSSIEENTTKEEVLKLSKKLDTLIQDRLKKKKGADDKLLNFLEDMTFTTKEIQKISSPLNDFGAKVRAKKLNRLLQEMNVAKNKMVEGNLRLVFSRAKVFQNKGLALEDLLQEGNIGLMKAIEKFDYERGYKFGTYATWWIDQALGRAIADKARLIRIPVHMVENINKLTKASSKLTQELGRDPEIGELSRRMDVSEDKIKKVRKVVSFPHSVEEPTGELGIPLSEYLEDTTTLNPHDMLERKEITEKIRSLLSKLSPKDEKILRMRFGIGEKKQMTLATIGNHFQLSKERVRQRINKSIEKLDTIDKEDERGIYHGWLKPTRS